MQNEFQPEENNLPETSLATETEAERRAARLVTEGLNDTIKRTKRVRRLLSIGYFGILGSLSLMVIIPLLFFVPNDHHDPRSIQCFVLGAAGFVSALAFCDRIRGQRPPVFNVNTMAQRSGVQAIAPLFAALQGAVSEPQKYAISYVLTTLLPLMKVGDANLLSPDSRRLIHSWFQNVSNDPAMTAHLESPCIAALKAFEQVGDSHDIPVVERLTNLNPLTPCQRKIKQAAIDCLPMLRANCGEVEAARTLLRASHAEHARTETLLRPASNVDTAAQDLLRGAEKP